MQREQKSRINGRSCGRAEGGYRAPAIRQGIENPDRISFRLPDLAECGLLLPVGKHLRFSEAFDAPPAQMFQAACQLGLEGLMFKRGDSPYVSARTQSWLKAKCKRFARSLSSAASLWLAGLWLVLKHALADLA